MAKKITSTKRKKPTVSSFLGPARMQFIAVMLIFAMAGVIYAVVTRAGSGTALFSATCLPSHIGNDDPIVFPGQPGAAHQHEFSGAMSTDAYSTADTLKASKTTCFPKEDTGAYWTPTLFVKGQRVEVHHTTAYYSGNGITGSDNVKSFPKGFRVIGDMKNSTPEKSGYQHGGWLCGSEQVKWGYKASLEGIIWHCPTALQNRIIFPNCWDGKNLDTVNPDKTPAKNPVTGQPYPNDHRSHMAYHNNSKTCPATHPVVTPQIDFKMTFKLGV